MTPVGFKPQNVSEGRRERTSWSGTRITIRSNPLPCRNRQIAASLLCNRRYLTICRLNAHSLFYIIFLLWTVFFFTRPPETYFIQPFQKNKYPRAALETFCIQTNLLWKQHYMLINKNITICRVSLNLGIC